MNVFANVHCTDYTFSYENEKVHIHFGHCYCTMCNNVYVMYSTHSN